MIKHTSKIIFFLLAVLIFSSCSKSDDIVTPGNSADTSTNFKYPYSINSNWFFTTTKNFTFRPDSTRAYISGIDSSVESGYAVWKNDTVINGVNARVLRSNHTSTNHSFNSTECYVQTDSGLVNISYDIEVSFGPFRPGSSPLPYFSSTSDFVSEIGSAVSPVNCLQYPIRTNHEWYFRNLSATQVQTKKYLNYEQVHTPVGTYNCIKIQRINYMNGIKDSNFVWYDYFSKIGTVKRSYTRKNVPVYFGGNIIGYYDIGHEVVLNSVNIIP